MITLKSAADLDKMRVSGRATAAILDEIVRAVKPGVSTAALDSIAEARCREIGAIPAFKGYGGFPASLCVSINEEAVHGIPSPSRVIQEGDLVSLDFGLSIAGWFGDSARTVLVSQSGGASDPASAALMDAGQKSLAAGIAGCRPGNRLFDLGHAMQTVAEGLGFSVVREFVGHGIGQKLHEEPQIPNFGPKGRGIELIAGMVFAIEPVINAGRHEMKLLADGWTAVTADGSFSVHFEHTVVVSEAGPEVLTAIPISGR